MKTGKKAPLMIALIILCLAVIICCGVKIFTMVKAQNPAAEPQIFESTDSRSDYMYSVPAENTGITWVVEDGAITAVQNAEG